MMPASAISVTRAKTSASEASTLFPTSAYGRESMGKCDWISFKMARSRSFKDGVLGSGFWVLGIVIRNFYL